MHHLTKGLLQKRDPLSRVIISSMSEYHLYTGTAAAEIDRKAINDFDIPAYQLMSLAGVKAFEYLAENLAQRASAPRILVLCGTGNNGGDGYVLAQRALNSGWRVDLVAEREPRSAEAVRARQSFLEAGGQIEPFGSVDANTNYDAIIDALLGIGLTSPPRAPLADVIKRVNQMSGFKLALDVPSGIDADTGNAFVPTFMATATITFIVDKFALHTGAACNFVGDVRWESLEVSDEIVQSVPHHATRIEPHWRERKADSHKGSYGHCLIAGASDGMLGAGLLAGEASLRAGAGKTTLLTTSNNLDKPALYHPELMSAAFSEGVPETLNAVQAVAVGPGMGLNAWAERLLESCIALAKPMVVDADALTLLAGKNIALPEQTILTPHPGEAASLLAATTPEIQQNRAQAALSIAKKYQVICVLKGAGTLVATPQGELSLCDRGNPAMATAGMGDVLTGIVVALLAQGYAAIQAAQTAVWWHASVADFLVGPGKQSSLLASDVAKGLSLTPIK